MIYLKLVYFEEFSRIDLAFNREKQVHGWSRKKKESLIYGAKNKLHDLSACKNDTHFKISMARLNGEKEDPDR